jgi:hypothetical protein
MLNRKRQIHGILNQVVSSVHPLLQSGKGPFVPGRPIETQIPIYRQSGTAIKKLGAAVVYKKPKASAAPSQTKKPKPTSKEVTDNRMRDLAPRPKQFSSVKLSSRDLMSGKGFARLA